MGWISRPTIAAFVLGVASAGCASIGPMDVRPDAPTLPPAAISRVPSAVGVYFPPEVREAKPEHTLDMGGTRFIWRHALGPASVSLVTQALRAVYAEVVELPEWPTDAAATGTLAAVIVPGAPSVSGAFHENAVIGIMRQNVDYALSVHRRGETPVVLEVTGIVRSSPHGPFLTQKALDERMLRSAGAGMEAALAAFARPAPDASTTPASATGVAVVRLDAGMAQGDGIERRLVECLSAVAPGPAALAGEEPAARLRDALFPWLDPGVAPRDAEALAALLSREEARERLAALGVGRLVIATARDVEPRKTENLFCGGGFGAGGCFGFYQNRTGYAIELALWDVATRQPLDTSRAKVETSVGVIGVLLPIPFWSTTAAEACAAMQTFVRTGLEKH